MSTIVTRAGKGSPLTNNEVDANFVNLNTDKIESITSADGSVVITPTGTARDLSVAISGSTTNVVVLVRNTTGATLTKGTAVYISGATGQNPTVSKALATSDATSAQTLGLMTADLANNSNGYVTVVGLITNINTSAYTDGAQLYLSGTTAGTLTATKPYAPIHLVYAAVVEHAHATQGKLFVKVQNGYELDEIHDVSAQSPTTGQTIVYNASNSLWEKNTVSLTAGVNGVLPTANGGTNLTSFTSGGVVYASSTSALATGSALTFDGTNLSSTGGATFQGGPTGYGGGEIRLGSTSASLQNAISTQSTGTPQIIFDHRGTSNTGSFTWRNGTGGGTTLLRLNGNANMQLNTSTDKTTAFSGNGTGLTIGGALAPTLALYDTTNTAYVFNLTQIEADSYLYNTANGVMVFGTNNAERMRITATGDVGIGTSSPASKLDVANGNVRVTQAAATGATLSIAGNGNTVGTTSLDFIQAADSIAYIYNRANTAMIFGTNNTERARIDASGNVMVGLSTAIYNTSGRGTFNVNGTTEAIISLSAGGTTATSAYLLYDGTNTTFQTVSNGYTRFGTNNAERMRLDSSGNLGLGVTPSAWASNYRALTIASGNGAISSRTDAYRLFATTNAYNDGTNWKYVASTFASLYAQDSSQHIFYTAPSGTAGNAITFTQAMTLTSAGDLGVGTTSPQARFEASVNSADGGGIRVSNSSQTNQYLTIVMCGSTGFGVTSWDNSAVIEANANSVGSGTRALYLGAYSGPIIMSTGSGSRNERARITAAGEFVVGSTTSGYSAASRGVIEINGASTAILGLRVGAVNKGYVYHEGTNLYVVNEANGAFVFTTNNVERGRFTAGGSLVLGTTASTNKFLVYDGVASVSGQSGGGATVPSAYHVSSSLFRIGLNGSVSTSDASALAAVGTYFSDNSFFKGLTGNAGRIVTGASSQVALTGGTIALRYAGSAASDTDISWSTALYVNNSGNVGIGTISPSAGTLTVTGKYVLLSDSQTKFGDSGLIEGGAADGNTQLQYFTGKFLKISASSTEMARFDASGNLLLGTTTNTNTSKLVVNGTISQTVGGTQYLVVDQSDIGTAPNEIPLNQYLGSLAYQNGDAYYNTGMTVGYRNRLFNGLMQIDQRNAGASVTITANDTYTLDRWAVGNPAASPSKMSIQQSTTAPTGYKNSLLVTSLTAYTISSGDFFSVYQHIEGQNCIDLAWGTTNASSVTLSFWVRSSLTGLFGGALQNSDRSRCFPFSYTINTANTWEQKFLTISGDVTGTWLTTNGKGISVEFGICVGSTYSGPANTWASANYWSATGATNILGTNGATWYVTGVQLEKGNIATSFDVRPYGTELALCQRYFESSFPAGTVAPLKGSSTTSLGSGGQPVQQTDWLASFTSGTINGYQKFIVPKRASPTMTFFGTSNDKCIFYDFGTKAIIYPAFVIASSTPAGFNGYNDGTGLTNNTSWGLDTYNWSASAEL